MKRPSPAVLPFVLAVALTALTGVFTQPALAVEPTSRAHGAPFAHGALRAHEAIIGGREAEEGVFASTAYVIDILGSKGYQCTGTVVSANLVLTAGHCVENLKTGAVNDSSGFRVVTGTTDPFAPTAPVSNVAGVIVYPGFTRRVDNMDAALLVLSTPTAAPPVSLASPSSASLPRAGTAARIVGWGRTTFAQQLLTEKLQWAETVVQGNRWCKRNAPPFYARDEICAIAPPSYSTGVCEGDSGGPLLASTPGGGAPVEIGIAVHVYKGCSTRQPSVFTRVNRISSWVRTWVQAYKTPPAPPSTPAPAPAPLPPPGPSSPTPVSSSAS
jgi:secreted trypsin-like serine protease